MYVMQVTQAGDNVIVILAVILVVRLDIHINAVNLHCSVIDL